MSLKLQFAWIQDNSMEDKLNYHLSLSDSPCCGGEGFDSRPNGVIAKDITNCTYCCKNRSATLIVLLGGITWPKTGSSSMHF